MLVSSTEIPDFQQLSVKSSVCAVLLWRRSKKGAFAYAEQIIALAKGCFAWVVSG